MRKISVALLPLALLLLLAAASAQAGDFRNADWGMSMEEVKASEKLELQLEQPGMLEYKAMLFGERVDVTYGFIDGALAWGRYLNEEEYTDNNHYLRFYDQLTGALTEKYGPPTRVEAEYGSDSIRDNPDTWAAALGAGKLGKAMQWDTGATTITAVLYNYSIEIACFVEYRSRQHSDAVDEQRRRENERLSKEVQELKDKLEELKEEIKKQAIDDL